MGRGDMVAQEVQARQKQAVGEAESSRTNRPYRRRFRQADGAEASVIENIIGSELRPHKVGTTITKKRSTLLRGSPERLHWSEEDVREALLSQR